MTSPQFGHPLLFEPMVTLRLFANLREAAGTATISLPGGTVGDVLDGAVDTFGPEFAAGLPAARYWVNGEIADRATAVAGGDEVAVIPPVSGGETAEKTTDWTDTTPALLGLILLTTFVIANVVSLQALAFAAVGGALAWLWDVGDALAVRSVSAPIIPALVGTTIAGNAAYRWGTAGLAAGLAAGLIVVLAWCLLEERHRRLDAMAVSAMMVLIAGLGSGGLILVRVDSPVPVTAFLVIMVLGAVSSWAIQRFAPDLGGLDPNLAGAVGVLIGALGIGFIADTMEPLTSLIAGAAAVAGWFAGRALGSMMRDGTVNHTSRAEGMLTALDGIILASASYWVALLLFG